MLLDAVHSVNREYDTIMAMSERQIQYEILPYSKWDNWTLPKLEVNDYGVSWPPGTRQIIKELKGFRYGIEKNPLPGSISVFDHFLKIIMLLFPHKIDLFKDVVKGGVYRESGRIWNNYCLDIAEELCLDKEESWTILAGPASANKTYICALYGYCRYLCHPEKTIVIISTTSAQGSERRIWGAVKEFHEEGRFKECGIEAPGEIIQYLKAITFDSKKQIEESDVKKRDLRSGIIVIPIPVDDSGESALTTIQGTKNEHVVWIVDELAQMRENVTRPTRNLSYNLFFNFIGIGNSSSPNDPHGKAAMPDGGLKSLSVNRDRRWISAKGASVLFLHGEESPNNHPLIDQSKVKKPSDYPFGYTSNPFVSRKIALEAGDGDIEAGKMTVDYWKFAIGWWAPLEATNSLMTNNLAEANGATLPAEIIVSNKRIFAGGDFAFSSGGDENTLFPITFGITASGKKQVTFPTDAIAIKVAATAKDEFNEANAGEFVRVINKLEMAYEDFGADSSHDAAITLNAMGRIASTHSFVAISSMGAAYDKDKYKNKVTELWFQFRDLIRTGIVRGLNTKSKAWTQACERMYETKGKGFYQIEPKRDMKGRIGRSPDHADAMIYGAFMLIRSGLISEELEKARTIMDREDMQQERDRLRELARERAGRERNYSHPLLTERFGINGEDNSEFRNNSADDMDSSDSMESDYQDAYW